ncbi:hypothetical protein DFQ30_007657 [Apophysomyces sp. BC1015]|nr:hypothetical protein DFQ30_007657 [Apophysomyces sp. BC1015]
MPNAIDEKCKTLVELLNSVFEQAKYYGSSFQLDTMRILLTFLFDDRCDVGMIDTTPNLSADKDDNNELRQHIIHAFGWELIEITKPFLLTADEDKETSREVRRMSAIMIQRIGEQTSWKEINVMAGEQISLLAPSTSYPDENKCVRTAIEYVEFYRLAGQGKLRALQTIIQEKSSWGCSDRPPSRWDHIVYCITGIILDFVEFGCNDANIPEGLWQDSIEMHTDTDEMKRSHLCIYLLTSIFEKVILNLDMDLSKAYQKRYHDKYHFKQRTDAKVKPDITMYSEEHNSPMLETRLVNALGMPFDSLFRFKHAILRKAGNKSYSSDIDQDSDDDGHEDIINFRCERYPLTDLGIVSILAMSIYDCYIIKKSANYPSLNLLPLALNPRWIGREFLVSVMNLLLEPQNAPLVDRGLFVLQFLADNVEIEITLDMFEKQLQGTFLGEEQLKLVKAFQIVSSLATMSPDSDFRLTAYQLIGRFLRLCNDEACLFALAELLEGCPFPTMKAAAVGLLKDQIDEAFKKQNNSKAPSVFTSRVVVDRFFPILFRVDKSWTKSDTEFLGGFGLQIQTLNFYLYLLIRDRETNQTSVRDKERIDYVMKEYIRPLEERVDRLLQNFEEEKLASNTVHQVPVEEETDEPLESKVMKLELLKNVAHQIKEQMNSA